MGNTFYKMMPFGLKNAGETYMRAMTTISHDMIHKEIEVYMDGVIIKSKRSSYHRADLKKVFDRLRKYNLKLNPAKCAFGVPAGKLLGFIISRRGIELNPSKIKAIQDLPPPKNKKDILQQAGLKNAKKPSTKSRSIKLNRPNWSRQNQVDLYYFICPCWMEPLAAFWGNKTKLEGKVGDILSEQEVHALRVLILFVGTKAVKGKALADHLAENPVDGEDKPLKTYFLNKEVSFVGEYITDPFDGWRIFFDGATNIKGVGIRAILVSETGVAGNRIFRSISTPGTRRMGYQKHKNIAIFALGTRTDQEVYKDRIQTCSKDLE
ncbi:uncharacterized protein [Nicotiana tomentosiformis]|uniref:uncharacterized protein n=1 Tax=Nicotiana tomentosiformis TaxID=4098 RepID=UPI00388CCA8F